MKALLIIIFIICFNLKSDNDIVIQEVKVVAALNKTMNSLRNGLLNAFSDGDVIDALNMCSLTAEDLTNSNNSLNTSIKRISQKYRNPENKPSKYELQILRDFEKKLLNGAKVSDLIYRKVINNYGKKTLVYLKAIPTKDICLNCHGSNIEDKVLKEIKILYPSDKAINFKLGDIRGAFSVRHNF